MLRAVVSTDSRGPAAVPETLQEALSPRWLTAALAPRFPGIEVTAVDAGLVIERVSTVALFTIDCAGGVPDGLSPQLCVKGYFNEIGRGARSIGEPEAYFYRDLAVTTGVRTLRPVYADIDPVTRHGVVITEDLGAAGGTFLDAASDYTPDQAAASLAQFAQLHAATWGHRVYERLGWLVPQLARIARSRGLDVIEAGFGTATWVGVPAEAADPRRLYGGYLTLIDQWGDVTPWSVVHGDAHVGNLFLDGAGRPGLVDWQLVHRGNWGLDVGYHLASTLSVQDRRSNEVDLLRHYLDHLAAAGVEVPQWDEAWTCLGRGILHGFYLWAITTAVDPAIVTTMLERLGTAAADHQVLASTTGCSQADV
jgi:Phosphotransferase enzyme family